MTHAIRVYVHGLDSEGKKWRTRYTYPSAYKLSRCIELAAGKQRKTLRVGVGFEEGAMTVHLRLR